MEPDERAVQERRDKKLVKIKERPLYNRSGDRFTDYAQFLRKLYELVLVYNQLAHCTVSLQFFSSNLMFIEEICETDAGNWQ